jgi:hypothetical protein
MTILRAAALAAIIAWAGVAHADCRRRFHDEAGLLVGIGILADFVGASVLADLITPSEPDLVYLDSCGANGNTPYGYAPSVDIGMRHCADQVWTRPTCWW